MLAIHSKFSYGIYLCVYICTHVTTSPYHRPDDRINNVLTAYAQRYIYADIVTTWLQKCSHTDIQTPICAHHVNRSPHVCPLNRSSRVSAHRTHRRLGVWSRDWCKTGYIKYCKQFKLNKQHVSDNFEVKNLLSKQKYSKQPAKKNYRHLLYLSCWPELKFSRIVDDWSLCTF